MSDSPALHALKDRLKAHARSLGFHDVGITDVRPSEAFVKELVARVSAPVEAS